MRIAHRLRAIIPLAALVAASLAASRAVADTKAGDAMIARYFRAQTAQLADRCLADINSREDWLAAQGKYRQQLQEMLGLAPWPSRTPLNVKVTGTVEHPEFTVRKLHYQSMPGLYVTGNLYVPKDLKEPAPAILYVCGHGRVKKDGVSYGNKSHYQHHGGWFARNGYVCLTIDTLQLGEIEGIHHGTYRYKKWWWNARGYTPAGVEAWNGIRGVDLLQGLEEVDGQRIGVTGRSGGGAYSWWVAALDERIKAAVPVAGITDLENHVVDGCVEGHCDCMFMVNTYRWDYAQVAALVAPRPLLISNTDKDRIFPLEGVVRTHEKVRQVYRLLDAADKLGLHITEGPHKDTQELRTHAFVWFDRFLKGEVRPLDKTAQKFFQPEQLKVFAELPEDERNTKISETFTPAAEDPQVPASEDAWTKQRDQLLSQLQAKSFAAWPEAPVGLDLQPKWKSTSGDVQLAAYDFTSQQQIRLPLYVAQRAGLKKPSLVVLNVLDEDGWQEFLATMRVGFEKQLAAHHLPAADEKSFGQHQGMFRSFDWVMAYVPPRGIGPTAWNPDERKQTQIRRRFMLLGQTLDGMRVWDARRAVQALRNVKPLSETQLWLQGNRVMAGIALYASLFEPAVHRLDLHDLPKSHRDGPIFLNVLRVLDTPQAVALAAQRSKVRIYQDQPGGWEYPQAVAQKLGWDAKQIQVRVPEGAKPEGDDRE